MLLVGFLIFILAVIQGVAPRLHDLTGWGQGWQIIAQYGDFAWAFPTGTSFNLWFALYLLALIYAVGQLLPGLRHNVTGQQLRPWAIALFLSSTAWITAFQLNPNGMVLVSLIWTMWGIAVTALFKLIDQPQPLNKFHQWISRPLFGLYAGWLSVCVWVQTSYALQTQWPQLFGLSTVVFTLLLVTTIVAFSTTLLLQTNGCRWFGAAVLSALYTILWHNLGIKYNLPLAIFTSVSILLVYTLLAITPVSRLFRYVRRTKMKEWLLQSVAFKTIQPGSTSFYSVRQTWK